MIPDDVKRAWDARERGAKLAVRVAEAVCGLRAPLPRSRGGIHSAHETAICPKDWAALADDTIAKAAAAAKSMATRKASQAALEVFGPKLPEFIGGSADLTPLEQHELQAVDDAHGRQPGGDYIHYGVREFGMAAIMNGIAAHGGCIPYGGTFLVFSDYARNGIRMSALIGLRTILCAYARLDRPRRGRADASADRARREPPADSAHARLAPVRYGRDGGRVARGYRAQERADEYSCSRVRICRTCSARPSKSPSSRAAAISCRRSAAPPEDHAHRDRLRGAARRRRRARCSRRRVSRRASCRCRAARCSTRRATEYRASVLPARRRAARDRGRRNGRLVALRRGAGGRASGSTRFGASAPGKAVFEHFGFTVDAVAAAARRLL